MIINSNKLNKMLLSFLVLITLVTIDAVVVPMNDSNETIIPVTPVEEKKIEWSPTEVTQIQYPPPNIQPPFVPSNYYLPAEFPGNQYVPPPPTTEFRSEHYAYPFEPNYPYPVSQQPIDSSLIPTAKHFVIVSFIGLLLLFAVIQNSIAAAKRKDALVEVLSNRKKRDTSTTENYDHVIPEIESTLTEDARVRCIQRTLCYENRKLREDLGIFGKVFAKYLTRSVQSSLKDLSPRWDRLIEDAADAGLRGEDCDVLYRDCNSEFLNDSETIDDDEE